MKMPPYPRKTFGKSLRKICERLDLPFVKTRLGKVRNAKGRKRKGSVV